MIEGYYSIFYTGIADTGFALVSFEKGTIIGVDIAGAKYDGEYQVSNDYIQGTLTLSADAGTKLVTGAVAGEKGEAWDIPFKMPIKFENEILPIETPTGKVNAIFRKLRDI